MGEKNIIIVRKYHSPCGELTLGYFGEELCLCDWQSGRHRSRTIGRLQRMLDTELEDGNSRVIDMAASQLDEYFAGARRTFDIPLLFSGTEFQRTVWHELLKIPYGTTVSYGTIARNIAMPKAVRAVANANGANPISIFAPCHRVIGSDNSLTGYGGGLEVKEFLLRLENAF